MIAYKMRIIDIVNGKLKQDDLGGLILSTPFGESKEARVLGTIVDSYRNPESTYGAMTLDDGTSTVRLKAFSDKIQLFDKFNVGEIVDVIGKIGEYQDEIYISPENIIPVTPNYWLYRELELSKRIKELMEKGISFDYVEEGPAYSPPEPESYEEDETTEEVEISEVEDELRETDIEELMEDISEEELTEDEEKDGMSFYTDSDDEEIKENVFNLLKKDPTISKVEISNVLSIDELDVEMSLTDLEDEGRIKSKDDGYEIIE